MPPGRDFLRLFLVNTKNYHGTVVLGTKIERVGMQVKNVITLGADEGLLIRLN